MRAYLIIALLLLPACGRGCLSALGSDSVPNGSRQADTIKDLRECRNTCPPGSHAMILKGGGGSEGWLWLCGCMDKQAVGEVE